MMQRMHLLQLMSVISSAAPQRFITANNVLHSIALANCPATREFVALR